MLKGIKEPLEILFLWCFIYLGAFIFLIIGIVHIQSNQPPIIKQYHTYNAVQVIETPKQVLVEREVCNRIDGCPVVKGVCESCETVKR